MSRTIVIASGKGGVGKSTVSAGLGRVLAENGIRTLLVDCDAGLSSLDVILNCRELSAFSWYDAYTGRCAPKDALIRVNDHLSLINAPYDVVPEKAGDAVKKVTDELKKYFDIIIVDAPAGLGDGLMRASKAASQAVVIATADEVSVKGAAAVDKKLRAAGITQTRLLINRYSVKAAKKGQQLTVDKIIDDTCVQLLGIVPEDKEITYSSVTGSVSKKSTAVKAFRRIADRMMGKNVELTVSLLK